MVNMFPYVFSLLGFLDRGTQTGLLVADFDIENDPAENILTPHGQMICISSHS